MLKNITIKTDRGNGEDSNSDRFPTFQNKCCTLLPQVVGIGEQLFHHYWENNIETTQCLLGVDETQGINCHECGKTAKSHTVFHMTQLYYKKKKKRERKKDALISIEKEKGEEKTTTQQLITDE